MQHPIKNLVSSSLVAAFSSAIAPDLALGQTQIGEKLFPQNSLVNRQYGTHVALSGDLVVAGSSLSQSGAAVFWVFDGLNWNSGPFNGTNFVIFGGSVVAARGMQALTGSPGDPVDDFGSSFVTVWDIAGPASYSPITGWPGASIDQNGFSVCFGDSDSVFFGSPESPGVSEVSSTAGPPTGVSFIQGGWFGFGYAIDYSDDTLVVSSPRRTHVHVFERSGPSTWDEVAVFGPAGVGAAAIATNDFGSSYGKRVAIEGDWIAVNHPNAGQVFLYERVQGLWIERQVLSEVIPQAFGADIDMQLGRLLIGAPAFSDTVIGQGKAYLYEIDRAAVGGPTWVEVESFESATPSDELLGTSVSLDLPRIAIGAPLNSEVGIQTGAVYVHTRPQALVASDNTFCYGDDVAPSGCVDCPCGNTAPSMSQGGCLNSAGRSARLLAFGSSSVSQDDLRMGVRGANGNVLSILLSGDQALPIAGSCPPGSGVATIVLDGLRCVGENVQRHGSRVTNGEGDTTSTWGSAGSGLASLGGFASGQTRSFQAHYRESFSQGCGTGQNTTNAVMIEFLP